jgi:hypothetical protein
MAAAAGGMPPCVARHVVWPPTPAGLLGVSLMKLDPQKALVVYECKDDPGSKYSQRSGLEHLRITLT